MKHFFYTMTLIVLATTATAQKTTTESAGIQPENIKASLVKNNLEVVWGKNSPSAANYWEVQGSRDGINYSTIGLVFGADPKSSGSSYRFKQEQHKIKPGFKHYRVLHIESENKAIASHSIRLSK